MEKEEEDDEIQDLEAIRDKMMNMPRTEKMQVSGWDDDNTGIESERNPQDSAAKAVLIAAEEGNIKELKLLLDADPSLVDSADKDGYTPLHRACYGNHVEAIQVLLQRGAKLDKKTIDGWEPLHSACCWNNINCIVMLISNGANVNALSNGDQTPFHLICSSSHNLSALQYFLFNPDVNKNVANSSGDTPEMIATRTGKYYSLFEIIAPCLNEI